MYKRKTTMMDLNLQNKLYRIALRIVNNSADAEDVVQDVLIKIWQKKDKLDHIQNKEAYYMMMARNQALDSLRKKKIKSSDIDEHYNIKDKKATPDRAYEGKDDMNRIMRLIEKLPITQKIVIQLRDIEGYSYKEIAEIAEITVDQVKVNLHRARITMREQLIAAGLRTG